MTVLITGGAGYIGSHIILEMINAGYNPVVVDNFSNSKQSALERVREMTSTYFPIYQVDLLDEKELDRVFSEQRIQSVVHCAGLKAVGESVHYPLHYYNNNVVGTLNLLKIMHKHNVKKIVFSSSATVYGNPNKVPITEKAKVQAMNPYGRTKRIIEDILYDLHHSDPTWRIINLRYFNPVGAHESGKIGEDSSDIPNNLLPYMTQVAIGKRRKLSIYGNDYPTVDGTGVRDYIHVVDLAQGHLKALDKVMKQDGIDTYNLGTGIGYSVLEMVRTFEKVNGVNIPYKIVGRRPGDIATCYADATKAKDELGWTAKRDVHDMCQDAWRWQKNNPNGYKTP